MKEMSWPKLGSLWSAHHAHEFVFAVVGYDIGAEEVLVQIVRSPQQNTTICIKGIWIKGCRESLPLKRYFDWYFPVCYKVLKEEK